ncbi:small basic protein 1-like [Sylvia atricapilla]|uniref:small basic protein 1-like n=1 Tax=Sylvia atricapilla TaxID=48155 RepID=UPI0033917954
MRVLCLAFAVLLLLSLATPGQGQPKGFCDGYCAHACGETEEWSFSPYCEELHCCIPSPSPKKGK